MRYLTISILFLLLFQTSYGKVITITQAGNKTIIQAVAEAQSGDTILVNKGIYKEGNILIKKSITIIGKGMPAIDGELKTELFTIVANHVSIIGFHLKNTGKSSVNDLAGIKCMDANHVTILNNQFTNTFFAIHLSNSDYSTIENNQLFAKEKHEYNLGNGIHLWKCKHAKIKNNLIEGHRDGIYLEFAQKSVILNNISKGNMRYGLHFMFSHENSYEDNIFSNNGAGVAVMYTTNVIMKRNTFEHNWGASSYGLLLKDIRDGEVSDNKFTGNTSGIYMENSSRILFENNSFKSNGWGIKLMASCDGNVFKFNNFSNNTFDISTNGNVVLNTLDSNYWDKYQGYDLNKDGIGDIPHRPVNLFSMIVERIPPAIMLWRSFLVFLLDRAEKVVPAITPENLKDNYPSIKAYDIS